MSSVLDMETLPMPLAIAQLVVVQHAPITLRFRADEKRPLRPPHSSPRASKEWQLHH